MCPFCGAAALTAEDETVPPRADPSRNVLPNPANAQNAATVSASDPSTNLTASAGRPALPGYELLTELGRGGMGVVYQARHRKLDRLVALKMILGGGHAGLAELERFRVEGQAIARLQKEPPRRYRTAADLADELHRFQIGEPIDARPVGRAERAIKWAWRNPTVAALLGAVAVLLLAAAGGGLGLARWALQEAALVKAEQERTQQQLELARENLFTTQLLRVASLIERDPGKALELLHDCDVCPIQLRDASWCFYERGASGWLLATLPEDKVGPVSSVAFSPDGKTLACAGNRGTVSAGTVSLWDLTTSQVCATFKGFAPVAFSADGATLAAAADNGTIQLWDLATRQARATLQGHPKGIAALAFSADGKTLASGALTVETVQLWALNTGAETTTINGQSKELGVKSLAFSADGKTLAWGNGHGTPRLWDLAAGTVQRSRVTPRPIASSGLTIARWVLVPMA